MHRTLLLDASPFAYTLASALQASGLDAHDASACLHAHTTTGKDAVAMGKRCPVQDQHWYAAAKGSICTLLQKSWPPQVRMRICRALHEWSPSASQQARLSTMQYGARAAGKAHQAELGSNNVLYEQPICMLCESQCDAAGQRHHAPASSAHSVAPCALCCVHGLKQHTNTPCPYRTDWSP